MNERWVGQENQRLRPSELVQAALDELDDFVALFFGAEFRLAAVNAAWRRYMGLEDEIVIGRSIQEVAPELVDQQVHAFLQRAYRTGQTQIARGWRIQRDEAATGEPFEFYFDFVAKPYRSGGDIVGVVAYGTDVSQQVRQRHAEHQKAAEAQRRFEDARDVVDELQHALLPTGLPVLPRVDIDARYLIASHDQAAGGDWFDAITLGDGRVALVVGDVVGHGVAASAAMGQLRAVLEQVVISAGDLASAVAQVDAFAAMKKPLKAATVAIVVLDSATGMMEYALCGHTPPLVVGTDGTSRLLEANIGGPLGVGSSHTVVRGALNPGDVVLLYSDGLIERPERRPYDAQIELRDVASAALANRVLPTGAAVGASARVCQLTVELLTRTGYEDDVTALAAQLLTAARDDLALSVIANRNGLTQALTAFRTWLDALSINNRDSLAIELSVNEAIVNAAEHAYPRVNPGRYACMAIWTPAALPKSPLPTRVGGGPR